jgi:hypothetical protein
LDTIRWALQTEGRCDLKNLLLVVALLLAWPTVGLSQAGQVIPRVALFGGFTRVFDKADPNSFSVGSFHFDGGEVSAEVRVSRCVGIVGGYGWQWSYRDGGVLQRLALIGPQFSPHAIHRGLIPFAHVLVGYMHGTIDWGDGEAGEGSVFAAAVGGGLDIKMGRGFWFRAIQADWLHADLRPDHHTTARISAGIVLRH